jgi:hypothetical protein
MTFGLGLPLHKYVLDELGAPMRGSYEHLIIGGEPTQFRRCSSASTNDQGRPEPKPEAEELKLSLSVPRMTAVSRKRAAQRTRSHYADLFSCPERD